MLQNFNPLISIVVITYQAKGLVLRCLQSIHQIQYQPIEVIVVDNCSNDGTASAIKDKYPEDRVIINPKNELLAEARNIGIREAISEFIFLLDNDNVLELINTR